MAFKSWLSSLFQPRRRPIRKAARRTTRFFIEQLEDRITPTHFRYGTIDWKPDTGNTVTFTLTQSWRTDYPWSSGTPTATGQVVITPETFEFGDGFGAAIDLTVQSISDAADDYFVGTQTFSHTYSTAGNYTAFFQNGNRLSTLENNANGEYRNQTLVDVGTGNSPPVSNLPPIVQVPFNDPNVSFQIPATDPNGDPITFRLETAAEAAGSGFTYTQPSGLAVSSTGLVTWSTVGVSTVGLWSAAVMVEDHVGTTSGAVKSAVPVDFLIQTVDTVSHSPPLISASPSGPFTTQAGHNVGFTVSASDPNAVGTITNLQALNAPPGMTFTPFVQGTPTSITASWTPTVAQANQTYVISLLATDNFGLTSNTSVTITVPANPPPTVTAPNNQNATEGASQSFSLGSFTDVASGPWTVDVNWGDGSTDTTFSATPGTIPAQSHTYAEEGSPAVTVTVKDTGDNESNAQTFQVATADAVLTAGALTLPVATEGAAFTNISVFHFTDSDPAGTASDYSALVTRGDGTSVTLTSTPSANGQIVAHTGGGFDVQLSYTYPEEVTNGTFSVAVTDHNATASAGTSTFDVADALLTAGQFTPPTATEGIAFTNVPVFHFTDADPNGTAGDYSALVTLGDGNTVTLTSTPGPNGQIVPVGGGFSVELSYTYADEMTGKTFSVVVTDHTAAVGVGTNNFSVADAPLTPTGVTITVTEGSTFTKVVALFSDANPNPNLSDFSATITWNDGNVTAGTIAATGTGFSVTGTNNYHEAGTYAINIAIHDVGGNSAMVTSTADVGNATLQANASNILFTEGAPFSGQVASFTDADVFKPASDFSATITWGDGNTSAGIVAGSNGQFTVSGGNTYLEEGTYPITVSIGDTTGATAGAGCSAIVADAPLTAGVLTPPAAVEGVPFTNQTVFHFTDTDPNGKASDYIAVVTLGDGNSVTLTSATSPNGQIVAHTGGGFDVQLSYTYAEELTTNQTFAVTVTDNLATASASTNTFNVADAPLTAGTITATGGVEGVTPASLSATFTDANTASTASDFSGTISWGDGNTTPFNSSAVSGSSGSFTVTASHQYLEEGSFSVSVSVHDDGGASAVITNSPPVQPITTNLALWLNADQGVSTNTQGQVTGWNDQSGNNFNGTAQGSGITLVNNALNGQNAVQFSGGGDLALSGQVLTSQQYTIIAMVTDQHTDTNFHEIFSDWSYSNTITSVFLGTADQNPVGVRLTDYMGSAEDPNHFDTGVGPLSNPTQPFVLSGVSSATDATVYQNQTLIADNGTAIPTRGLNSQYFVGDQGTFNSEFWQGNIYEIMVYNGALTPTQVEQDVSYLQVKYFPAVVQVADAPLTAGSVTAAGGVEGMTPTTLSATFTDANPNAPTSDFSGTINWGDGTLANPDITTFTSSAVSGTGGSYTVGGSHQYADEGNYTISVAINDGGTSTTTDTGTTTVADASLDATSLPIDATEGISFTGLVATFTDANPNAGVSDFSATINWDASGATSPGTITVDPHGNGFDVTGTHTYAEEGTLAGYPLVGIYDGGGSMDAGDDGIVSIADAPLAAGTLSASSGGVAALTPTNLSAAFTDANTGAPASDFSGTINWGDGTALNPDTTTFTSSAVSGSGGSYSVSGSHQYLTAGNFNITATINDDGGQSTSDTGSATVARAASFTTTIGAGPFTYDGTEHFGGSGTVTGAGGLNSTNVTLTYSANADGTGVADQIDAGTYYVIAHYAGDANHLPSDGAAVVIDIGQAAATISVTGYSGDYTASPHGVVSSSATGVGGAAISGLSVDPTTFTDVPGGSVGWTFSNIDYLPQSGNAPVTINPVAAAISVTGYSGDYTASPHGVVSSSATGVGGAAISGLSVNPTTFTDVPGGSVGWTFSNIDYLPQSGNAPVTINPVAAAISVTGYSGDYTASPHGVVSSSATGVGGAAISGLSVDPTTFTDVPGGSVGWTFSNIDYLPQSGSAPVTINPVAATISVTGYSGDYTASPHGVISSSATGVGGAAISGLSVDPTTFTDVPGGSVGWTFSNIDYLPQSGSASVTINPVAATISVTGYSGDYTASPHGVVSSSATGVGGAAISGLSVNPTTFTDVPGGSVGWTFSNIDYLPQSGNAPVTINPVAATISVTGYSGDYTASPHGVVSSSATGVGGAAISGLSVDPTTFTDVPGGSFGWTFSNIDYLPQSGSAPVTINPVAATISVTGYSGDYTASPHGVVSSSATGVGGAAISGLSVNPTTFTDVPGGSVGWTFSNIDYLPQSGNAPVTINPVAATISVTGYSGDYTASPHGVVSSSATGVGGAAISGLSVNPTTFTDVPGGSFGWTFSNIDYLPQSGSAPVTINPVAAAISVTGYSGDYTASPHGVISSSATGVGGAAISGLSVDPTTFTDVPGGSVGWTFSNIDYLPQSGSAPVTINPVAATISVTGYSGDYTASPHGVISSSATGVGGAAISGLSVDPTTFTNVPGGSVGWTFSNIDYLPQSGNAPVTINPVAATISVTGYSGDYTASPHGVISSSATGVGGAAISGLSVNPTTFTDVPGGSVGWTFSNIDYLPQSGSAPVTINKATSSVSVTPTTFTYNGATQSHGAYLVSGVGTGITQTVTWSYVGDQVDAGTYTATATYAGDANHLGSSASATMTITPVAETIVGDVYVLNKTASGALTVSGNAQLNVAGTLQVDSNSAGAVMLSGNADVNAARTQIVGGDQVSGNAHFLNAVTTGAAYIANPLAAVASLNGSSAVAINVSGTQTLTLSPGAYASITVSGSAHLILSPGIYVIGTGGVIVSGNGTVTGGTAAVNGGVLLYNNGALTVSGNASVNLTASSTGDYAGLAIFQALTNSSPVTISGNANLNLNGSFLYDANVQSIVTISGNARIEASMMVNELTISGNSDDIAQ